MSINQLLRNARNYLSRLWGGQLLAFLFFLGLSAAFWVFLAGKEVKEYPFTVSVDLVDVPDNVIVTTEPPKKLTLVLRDEAFTLMRYRYRKLSHPHITISWREVQNSRGHVRLLTENLIQPIREQLLGTTETVAMSPDTIEFFYNYGHKRLLDVSLQGIVRADSAYALIACNVGERKVAAYGPPHIVDTMTAAYTRTLNVLHVKDTTRVMVGFMPVRGVKFVPETVEVTAVAHRLVDKTVQVAVQGINFPAGKVLRTFPPKVNVSFQIGEKYYNSIDASAFTIAINYADLLELEGNVVPLRLRSTPDGVQNARIQPGEVEFVIEDDSGE